MTRPPIPRPGFNADGTLNKKEAEQILEIVDSVEMWDESFADIAARLNRFPKTYGLRKRPPGQDRRWTEADVAFLYRTFTEKGREAMMNQLIESLETDPPPWLGQFIDMLKKKSRPTEREPM